MVRIAAAALSVGFALLPASVSAHGYVKMWSADGGSFSTAQKTDLSGSSFRSVSSNTGWIGSHFLTTDAIACGAETTPRQTVTAPSGAMFATADQSAGQTLAVKAGGKVNLVISGNPGQGWPHPNGHVQAYLGSCGKSCQNFDATTTEFFKILGEKNGIQNTLKPAYDGSVDGNRYSVAIPNNVADGNYIFRFELIAFGQSAASEGNQDQYYPFCGQVAISGGSAKSNSFSAVKFPGAYENGNIDPNTLPGPTALATGPAISSTGGTKSTTSTSDDGGDGSTSSSSKSSSSSSKGSCKRRRSLRRERHGRRLSAVDIGPHYFKERL